MPTSDVTDRFSVAVGGFPEAHTAAGQKAAREAARGFWDALQNHGATISSDLQGRGYLPTVPGVLDAYSVALGQNLGKNAGVSLKECFDIGTLLNDPVFRMFLMTCGGFPDGHPGPTIAAPVALRAYRVPGSGTPDVSTFDLVDGGQILRRTGKKEKEKDVENNPGLHAHVGELGSHSCLDYPHAAGGGKSCLLEVLRGIMGSKNPPDVADVVKNLRVLAEQTKIEPWVMWETLPPEYRDIIFKDQVFGDAAKAFHLVDAPDYKKYVEGIAQVIAKVGMTGTGEVSLIDFLRESGCPPKYPWGLLGALSNLLRTDPALAGQVQLAYHLLARCCAHGLFFVMPEKGLPRDDPEAVLRNKKHPLIANPYIRYPLRWKVVTGGVPKKREAWEEPPINVIGNRLDALLALVRNIVSSSPMAALEEAWEAFLSVHANPASRQYPKSGSKEWKDASSGDWPPFAPNLIKRKTVPAGRKVPADQLLPWLYFTRSDLRAAVQQARALTLKKSGSGTAAGKKAREQSPFAASLFPAYRFSSYRFLLNYMGGQLLYFSQYVTAGGTIDLAKLREDPIAILRLMLELGYVLSCWFHRSASLNRRGMPKVIEEAGDLATAQAGTGTLKEDYAGLLAALSSELKAGSFLSAIADTSAKDIEPPSSEDAPYHAWLPWALQKGLRGGGWFPFFFYIFWWQVSELVEIPKEDVAVWVNGQDKASFFKAVFTDKRFERALAMVGPISSILCHFFRSSGVYVDHSYPDYLPPGADLATVVEVAKRQARARFDAQPVIIGGKVRDRDVAPRDVLVALSHLVASNNNSFTDEEGKTRWYPIAYQLNDAPQRAENRIWIRVPGGKKVATLEEKRQSKDYVNIDRHVWAAVSGRLNERGGNLRINIGDAMRTRFHASRGALADPEASAQARDFRRARKHLSALRDRGDDTAGQSWEKEGENQEYFRILCDQFNKKENLPEFASWAFSKSLRGPPRHALRSLSPEDQDLVGNQLRNRFDVLHGENLGKKVNKKNLPGKLDELQAKLLGMYCRKGDKESDLGRFVKDKLEHFRRAGLLPFLDPRLYEKPELPITPSETPEALPPKTEGARAGTGATEPEPEKPSFTGWIQEKLHSFEFLYEWEITFVGVLLADLLGETAPKAMKAYFATTREGKTARGGSGGTGGTSTSREITDLFKELEEAYPPICRITPPFEPPVETENVEETEGEGTKEEEEGEGEGESSENNPESIPCLEDLVLAVMRALALHHERLSLETAGGTGKNPKGNAIRVKLLRAAYAQESLNEIMREPGFREDLSFRATPGEGRLSFRGMAAPLAVFCLPPQKRLIQRYAGTMSGVFKDYATFLAAISVDILEAEDAFTTALWKGNVLKLSSPLLEDFYIAGQWLYQVIGTIAAFAGAGGDLRDARAKLQAFIASAEITWQKRQELLRGVDWSNKSARGSIVRDIADIEDPFNALDLGVNLAPPMKETFKHTPLPLFLQLGKGDFATFITPEGKPVDDFDRLLSGIAAGQDSILYKVNCPPLLPEDALVTRRKYLPEAGLGIHNLIVRERTARKEADWQDRHERYRNAINFAEDTGEFLLGIEKEGGSWFMLLSFLDARRRAIWTGINSLIHLAKPCKDEEEGGGEQNEEDGGAEEGKGEEEEGIKLAEVMDRINVDIAAVQINYPMLIPVSTQILTTPLTDVDVGALTSDEVDVLGEIYTTFIKDLLVEKQGKRQALMKGYSAGESNGFFRLMDGILDSVPLGSFHAEEYWRKRIIARATRQGLLSGENPPIDLLDAYVGACMNLLNLGSRLEMAMPGIFQPGHFHDAVESLRNWVRGKDLRKVGDSANYFYVLQSEVDTGVPYRQDPRYWDDRAQIISAGIASFKNFLESRAVAGAPLAAPGTLAFPRILKDEFSVAAARELMGAIGRDIARFGRETRDNYRALNYYRSRQHEGDMRSSKESRRARDNASTVKYIDGEFNRSAKKREFNRTALKMAWGAALQVKKFKEYYHGPGAWHEIRLPDTLVKFIRANVPERRVGIASINLLPPQYPAKHATVAIGLLTSRKAAEGRKPGFIATLKRAGAVPGGDVVVSYDINQWNSRRTFAVNVVVKTGEGFRFLLSERSARRFDFPGEVDRAIQGIPPHAWPKFFERVRHKVMRNPVKDKARSADIDFPYLLATPTYDHPYHLEFEGKEDPEFNDNYSAVEYYRATHATHENSKAVTVRRKRRVLQKRAVDAAEGNQEKVPKRVPEAPSGRPKGGRVYERLKDLDGSRLRRRGQADLLEARATNLRAFSLGRQARKVTYGAIAFGAKTVVCERITFFAKGIPGAIGKIRQLMPKDFRDIWAQVETFLRVHGTETPELRRVPAPRTSQVCITHGNQGGEADDRFSHDRWRCTKGGEIVDGHVNAAGQIGLSKWRGEEEEEDDGGG